MTDLIRVRRVAAWLHALTGILLFAVPIAFIAILLTVDLNAATIKDLSYASQVSDVLQTWQIGLWIGISVLVLLVYLGLIGTTRSLFGQYAKGEILSHRCAKLIQRIGWIFLVLAGMKFALTPLETLLLSYNTVEGSGSLTISISSTIVLLAIMGGLILMIGWVMAEATRISAEYGDII